MTTATRINNMPIGFDERGELVTVSMSFNAPITRQILTGLLKRLAEMNEPLETDVIDERPEAADGD